MSRAEAHAFFASYRDHFNRLDGDAVANLWNACSGIAHASSSDGHGVCTMWPDDAPMRNNMRALCDAYRKSGYAHAEFQIEKHEAMGANHAFSVLHWRLYRSDDSLLQAFHTGYQLLRTAQGIRVLLATQYEEDIDAMKNHATH
jgi:hypothetical protein